MISWKHALLAGTAITTLGLGVASVSTVDEGHRGIQTRLGKVISEEALMPGLHFKVPFIDTIIEMSVREQLAEITTQALTSDSQKVKMKSTFNYSLSPDRVVDVYKKYGTDYHNILVNPAGLSVIAQETGQVKAEDLVNKKSAITQKMDKVISQRLNENGFTISNFSLPVTAFSAEFTEAIELKEMARQAALQEEYNTARNQELVKQEIEKARGQAEALKLASQAEADAIRLRAEAAAASSQSLEFEIINKWNGQVPLVVGGGANILDIKSLLNMQTGSKIGQEDFAKKIIEQQKVRQ